MAGRNLISQNDSTQKASLLRVVVGRGERSTPGLRLFLRLLSRSRFSCGCVVGFGWMVVRFVRVIRLPACARVSRVIPGSPRCLFTCARVSRVSRSRLPRCLFTGTCTVGAYMFLVHLLRVPAGRTGSMLHRTFYVVELGVKRSGSCHVAGERQPV